jgi:polysaccharide pyruvyl transferase WcaK-like protein
MYKALSVETTTLKQLSPSCPGRCSLQRTYWGRPPAARVVVAMRLHAALMALNAGHYVVHLSYERKGFGAFQDLGLGDYVFNVHNFNPDEVSALAHELASSEERRANYDNTVREALDRVGDNRSRIVESLRVAVGNRHVEPSR